MSTPDSSDSERVLYLEQIDIEIKKRTRLHIRLQKDNDIVEIQQKGRALSWTPSRNLELIEASKLKINARIGLIQFGKFEALVELNGEQAMQEFWDSKQSVSCPSLFEQQPVMITFHFRPSHTSETIRAAVQNLQTAMEDYRSLMTDSTEQRIDTVIKFGIVLAELNPFAKLAFGIAKCSFDLLKEQRKYDENVSDLASGIEELLPFAERALEGVLYEEELLDGVVRRLYKLIGDTVTFIIGYAKRGPAIRALSSTISLKDHKRIEALQGDIAKLKVDFDRALNVEVLIAVRRSEEARLLERLKPVDTNHEEDHSCMEGTRTKILDDIFNWVETPFGGENHSNGSNSNVFWVYGTPGVGKTSVANSLCDRLRKSGNLGGNFFCKHDNPDLREPKRVLPTLIAQLVQMWGPFRKLVAKILLDEPLINPQSTRGELLLKPLQLLKKHPPHSLVLVIDALDECGQASTRGPLLNCLIEACSLVHWLKIVVTSRPERDVKSVFDRCHVTGRDLAVDGSAREDIRVFTERRMASIASGRHLSPDWPGTEHINKIIERSDGLFIFVETAYRLMDVPEPEPLLTRVLGGKLQGVNSTLHHLYSTVLTSRIARPTPSFHSILRAIIAVSENRPLCDESLAELINEEPQVVRSWVDELSSLLYRDESKKGGIRIRHLSILEFLVGPSCPPEFRVDVKLANVELSGCCLGTMAKKLKFNICELETSYLSNVDIQDLNDRVERRIHDALQYSCVHWFSHLCYDIDPISTETTRLFDAFFTEPQLLYWLEVLSLMGKVPVAVVALRLLKTCFKKFEDRHQHLVEGALRFVLAFFTPISTSAPHIYISALPFTPIESTVYERASVSFPGTINVCKGRTRSWPSPSIAWKGHTGSVCSVAYSPGGQNVVSGSDDCTIRIWDAQTGVAVGGPLRGHTGYVMSVAYSPDGQNVVSGSDDKTIRIWDAQKGVAVGEPLRGHTSSVTSVAYSPDGQNVVSGSWDNTIRIWDAQTGVAVGEPLRGHTSYVRSVAYSPDGQNIVSGSGDHTIRIWDAQTGVAVGEPLRGHTSSVKSVAYSPDGQNVVSGSSDDTIRIWDAQTGVAVGEPLRGHTSDVMSVAYSPDGQHVVSGSDDHTIRIRDAQTGVAVGEPLRGHTSYVMSVAYSPDGQNIVSGSGDHTIRIWDAQTGVAVGEPLRGHTSSVKSVAYSPDGQNVVSGSSDDTIRIWDAQTGVAVGEPLRGHTSYVRSVAYSPDGQNIVSGSGDHTIRIWDAQTGVAVGEPLRGHTSSVTSVAYSPDGQNIVSGSEDHTIRIWDAQTGVAVGEPLRGHTGSVMSVAYSPDGQNVVSGSWDNTIRIWDARTGVAVGEPLRGHTRSVTSVAYSPDGRNVVSGSRDNTIRIWDARTGVAVGETLRGHTDYVTSVACSPDGQNIVSGSEDHTIRTWDAQTRVAVGEPLRGHTDYVTSVAYSPDGQNVVSGSEDNTIRIWDAETGVAVGELLRGHTSPVTSVAYSPDVQNVVSGAEDETIRIWGAEASMEEEGHSTASGSNNLSNNHLSLDPFSRNAIPEKLLDSNGWVRSADRLLLWVPEDCRHGLTCPAITTIPTTGSQRCVRIDFTHFQHGTLWTNVRRRNTEVESQQ